MNIPELVYESVKKLPVPAAREVLDFALFLAQREARQEDQDFMLAQQSALGDWDNAADEVWNDVPAA
ncbi:hypothetical protein [uncultured Thiodictyon sp.]|uniref:hypothetical protein n=1 Tax=uncultured Thiodictyon sp. TaxID=1846217 RepID=UPI0025E4D321|nr:hypothetical protein [uncultured Thiodictyon sp.]